MKQNRNYSVAWFKLAELVSRGEKEKALNLFRLLSHSFEERAYSLQLEGDILWAFEDKDAVERYKQAAFLYKKEQKIMASIAVYEHLFTLEPRNYEFVSSLVKLYAQVNWPEKFKDRFKILLDLMESNEASREAIRRVVEEVESIFSQNKSENKKGTKRDLTKGYKALKNLLKDRVPELAERVATKTT